MFKSPHVNTTAGPRGDPSPVGGGRGSIAAAADEQEAAFRDRKERLLELLAIYTGQGHLTHDEIGRCLGLPSDTELPALLRRLEADVEDLEAEVRYTKASDRFFEAETDDLEVALAEERDLVGESLVRIAHLESQLREARLTTLKLIAASRESLVALRRIQSELAPESFAQEALTPLISDLHQMADTIQELHTLALIRTTARADNLHRVPVPRI